MTLLDFVIRLSLAFLSGALIGLERQWRHRMAGLRTNALVATGAALFVMISFKVTGEPSITRIAAQVVSGVGFLGAGVIMRDGLNIRGLSTAATLWCSAAIGSLSGAGFLIESLIGSAMVLFANIALRPFSRVLSRTPEKLVEEEISYAVRVICKTENGAQIRSLLLQLANEENLVPLRLHSETGENASISIEIRLSSIGRSDAAVEKIVSRVSLETRVMAISWQVVP
ncbi:MAG: MgtC/SapB family protein [Firmicutes bacterium]|nr:MgtC/SapB family protein [Bacillota bacterium]